MANVELANRCRTCLKHEWCGRMLSCASDRNVVAFLSGGGVPGVSSRDERLSLARSLVEVPVATEPEKGPVLSSGPELGERVSSTYRYRDVEKRKAYMREYMRKRRSG